MFRSLTWLVLLIAAPAAAQPTPEDLRGELCDRALRVGGPLEDYLAGVGVDEPAAVARAQALFDRLVEAHPELPTSYVKLAVLLAAEASTAVSAAAAETALEILVGCREEPADDPPPSPQQPVDILDPGPVPEVPAVEEPVEPAIEAAGEEAVGEAAEVPSRPAIGHPRETFLEGVALADRGALAEAEAVFRSLIATYPQLPEPYVNLAVLLAAAGDDGGAGRMAESALLAHPLCRAAFELEMVRDFGDHSRSLLADLGLSATRSARRPTPAHRVVGPDWIPSPGDHLDEIRQIADTVAAWLAAWSEGRVDDYLGFYSDGFQPADGDVRQWRAERRRRLAAAPTTQLEISDLDVDVSSPVAGSASFTLRRRSSAAGVSVVADKYLELEKVDEAWRIVLERPGE